MTSYWLRLARKTEWGPMLSLVSPSFFDVLPARALFSQGRDLLKNLDAKSFAAARQRTSRALTAAGRPVSILAALPGKALFDEAVMAPAERRLVGELLLELYFRPLLGTGESLLDLRAERLALSGDGLLWAPGSAWVTWDADFLLGIGDLYRGFYREEPEVFAKGLAALGLERAEALLRKHFGEGDQTAVRFEVAHFQKSFHAVFTECRKQGVSLHRNFLPLGLALATLYTTLERLDVALDVRAAFERSAGGKKSPRRRARA